jgi:hypothetical protein
MNKVGEASDLQAVQRAQELQPDLILFGRVTSQIEWDGCRAQNS